MLHIVIRYWLLYVCKEACPAPLRLFTITQPECNISRLHSFLYYRYQFFGQCVQVHFFTQSSAEGLQHKRYVVPAAIETAIDNGLDAPFKGLEQSNDRQGSPDDCQFCLSSLPAESPEKVLQKNDAAE